MYERHAKKYAKKLGRKIYRYVAHIILLLQYPTRVHAPNYQILRYNVKVGIQSPIPPSSSFYTTVSFTSFTLE